MNYFPLFIRLEDAPCLVVGGGEVAVRKVRLLLRGGARVTVMAPDIHESLQEWASDGQITLDPRSFEPTAVAGQRLVVAATNQHDVNVAVSEAAAEQAILCNVVDDRQHSSAIMPALIDRSPLVIAISTGGASPVLATRIRQQLEQLYPQAYASLADFAERWRDAVKQRFTALSDRRHFWQQFFDGPIARDVLAGDTDAATAAMRSQVDSAEPADRGYAWIVGAGPGDPELLTLKAARVLATADTILHDRLVAPGVLDLARRDAEFISVGKQAGRPSISQDEINELLVAKVREGKTVCRLKGGDPFIFGRGGEEIEALQAAGLPWQVIPGITAASGCAAAAGIPLTHREIARSVTLITAHKADASATNWSAWAQPEQTLVIYMGISGLAAAAAGLIDGGRAADCPVVVIENGTTDRQRMVRGTLDTIADHATQAGIASPALVMVGEVTELNRLIATELTAPDGDGWSPAARSA